MGVKYSATKGYDAAQGAAFFQTLKRIGERDKVVIPGFLSTHPDPGDRERTIVQLARQYERPNSARAVGEDDLLSHIDGLVVGTDPREGFVRNNTFYHPGLAFQFPVPRGWKVENTKSAVLLADPQKQAVMVFEPAPGRSAREAAAKVANSQGVKIVRSENRRINGADAVALLAQANTGQGTAALLNYFIEQKGRVYSFAGLTGASRIGSYSSLFENVVKGFSRVEDSEVLNAQPTRLAIVTVDRPAPFASLIPTGKLGDLTPEDLAIINQVELNQVIPAGKKVKVPREGGGGSGNGRSEPSQSRQSRPLP